MYCYLFQPSSSSHVYHWNKFKICLGFSLWVTELGAIDFIAFVVLVWRRKNKTSLYFTSFTATCLLVHTGGATQWHWKKQIISKIPSPFKWGADIFLLLLYAHAHFFSGDLLSRQKQFQNRDIFLKFEVRHANPIFFSWSTLEISDLNSKTHFHNCYVRFDEDHLPTHQRFLHMNPPLHFLSLVSQPQQVIIFGSWNKKICSLTNRKLITRLTKSVISIIVNSTACNYFSPTITNFRIPFCIGLRGRKYIDTA